MTSTRNSFLQNLIKGLGYRTKKLFNNEYKKAGLSWSKIKYLKHLPYNEPHVYKLNGNSIHYNNGPELLHSLKEIFVEEIYKIDFPTQQPYILDCGSNIGLAVFYLKNRFPQARIIAFEPDKSNFTVLQKNIQQSGYSNVELHNEAIWKENTTLQFQSEGTLGSKIGGNAGGEHTVPVKATRLKDLLTQKIDFLKMDIEGAEYEVLKDCGDSLKMIRHLFIEFHGHFNRQQELTEILQLLTANSFSYYIKEASNVYSTPFYRSASNLPYDIQLNIFCFQTIS